MDLGESAEGGEMMDFAWEWLRRCHIPDGESVVRQ